MVNVGLVIVMISEVVIAVVEAEMMEVIWMMKAIVVRVAILISGSAIFRPEVMFFCAD